jgi:hypothetical protein
VVKIYNHFVISSTNASNSFVRSSVETVGFGVLSPGVVGVFPVGVLVVLSGVLSSQETVAGVVVSGAVIVVSTTGTLSSGIDRIREQLESVRERIMRGRKECFIVKKDRIRERARAEAEDRERNLLV